MITVILLNYNRPGQLPKVIDCIKKQTVKSKILLWDNSGSFRENRKLVDVYFNSSVNLYCQPRYMLASLVTTRYIWTQDDDFFITDARLFERLINLSIEYPDTVLTLYGKNFDKMDPKHKDKWYSTDEVTPGGGGWVFGKNRAVQFGASGICFFPTKCINKLPGAPYQSGIDSITLEDMRYADDQFFSYYNNVRVAPCIQYGVDRFNDDFKGLSSETEHYKVRDALSWRYWGAKNV